jgi:CubicO group peptidase (beta-lactamase class C family)
MALHRFEAVVRNSSEFTGLIIDWLLWARYSAMIVAFATLVNVSAPVEAAEAPAPEPEKLQLITDFFETEVGTGRLPGAVVLIQQHGRPVYLKTFGVRDVGTKLPMTPDTMFALHSMTKPITSFAAMMLVDAGKLSLDDPVAKYIPSFADMKVAMERVDARGQRSLELVPANRQPTIRDLLLQTSGIAADYVGGWVKEIYSEAHLFDGDFDNAEFAVRIAKLPLTRQPGTFWRYGHSTNILGRVIEIVSGETLYDFMKERLFDPLGMTHTKFVLDTPEERSLMAEALPGDTTLVDEERMRRAHPKWQSGGGGLVSTIVDYARFAQMLLDGGAFDGKNYLSSAAFRDMTADHIGPASGVGHDYFYFPGDGFGFGYGLAVRTDAGATNQPGSIGELKWDSGSGTYVGIDPKLDMVYILMEQTEERGRIRVAFRKLVFDAFASRSAEQPLSTAAGRVEDRNHFAIQVNAVDPFKAREMNDVRAVERTATRHLRRRASLRPRFGVPQLRMASTRSGSGGMMPSGQTGTPSTSFRSSPARSCHCRQR